VDPVGEAMSNAAPDDEPFTDEDRSAVVEADEWRQRHEPIPLETVLDEFGLNISDWEKMGNHESPERND
jgi:hypothetical protein